MNAMKPSKTIFSTRAIAGEYDPFFPMQKVLRRISGTADFTSKPAHRKGGRSGMRKVATKK